MSGMGPPPKPAQQRQRRNATVAMVQLPAEGRSGRAPRWPLVPDVVLTARRDVAQVKVDRFQETLAGLEAEGLPTDDVERRLDAAMEQLFVLQAQLAAARRMEAALWRELWRLPQAVEWERQRWTRSIAQYTRHQVLAELGDLDAAKEARQWSDRLGLSPMSMLRLRWEVVRDEVAARRQQHTASAAAAAPADPFAALRAV